MSEQTQNQTKKFFLGNMLALAATVIWAGNFIAAKILANAYSGLEMSYWRWLIAMIFAFPFAMKHMKQDIPYIFKEWKLMLFYGGIGCFFSNLLLYNAPHTAPAVDMTILMATSPLLMMFLSWIFFKEKINPFWIMGSIIALIGVCVLVTKGNLKIFQEANFTVGHFWTLGCSFFFALYSISLRLFKEKINIWVFLETTFIIAFIANFSSCLIFNQALPVIHSFKDFGAVLYIGIFSSLVAYICWNKAIELIGAVRTGIIYYLVPVFGSFFAVILINETIGIFQLIGGTMVLGGVLICTCFKNH